MNSRYHRYGVFSERLCTVLEYCDRGESHPTSPSSGQATDSIKLRHQKIHACHSGAALYSHAAILML